MFPGCAVPPGSNETEFGSSDQEASPSPNETTRVVLVPYHAWNCVPTTISGGLDISEVLGCHLLRQVPLRVTTITSRIVAS